MVIFICGDPHFKRTNKRETDQLVTDCLKILKVIKPDFIVILGDVFDESERVYLGCMGRINEMIKLFKEIAHVYILIGNHERLNNKVYLTDEHPFISYKEIEGVTIVDICHKMEWNGKKICMMPYVPNGMFHQACEDCDVNITDYDLFFCHQEFKNCQSDSPHNSECDEWGINYPFCISGHIHKKHMVGKNLFYPGSPFQVKFKEDTDKGVYSMNENFEFEQYSLRIPKKIEINIDHTEIDKLLDVDQEAVLKILITGPKETVKELIKRPDIAEKIKNATINYIDTTKMKKTKNEVLINTPFEVRIKNLLKDTRKKELFDEIFPDF